MTAAISVQQLSVEFRSRRGNVVALHPLDLDVAAGRIVGVLGPNGSGKTTLLRVLAGLQQPTDGRVQVLGKPPDAPILQREVGYQPEGPLPHDVLSAPEFLAYIGAAIGLSNAESDRRAAYWLQRLELEHAGKRWIRGFSTGMRKRLALAAALLGQPRLLLLDEPTAGLDPFGSATVMAVLRELAATGCSVLMASHQLLEVEEICDEVLLLQNGKIRARGQLSELLATDTDLLAVRGLAADGLQQLAATAKQLGGEVLRVGREREHLFALFRRYAQADTAADRRAP